LARSGPYGAALRAYLFASPLIARLAPFLLKQRLKKGREDADRWREKLGEASHRRPEGPVVWLHAVGVGEVLALRGLIQAMTASAPELSFLVTSSARSSARVFALNCPPRTIHQYLPLDAPAYLARFLDHWQPDLSVWAEQDLWPGAVVAAHQRGIPLALVNARMNAASYNKRKWARRLYADLYSFFALISAQDEGTAGHLLALGAPEVDVDGSLKIAAPELSADAADLVRMQAATEGRWVWLAASTHPEDEAVVLQVQAQLYGSDPRWLLVLVPRDPHRLMTIDMPFARRSVGEAPGPEPVYLADTYGELGLWYRLAEAALIGGSFGPVEGHNPWEAAALGCAVLHGPNTANFAADYKALDKAGAAQEVSATTLPEVLAGGDMEALAVKARGLVHSGRLALLPLAEDLIDQVYEK
jgi:3-deoxy-D-manno-octulosonic-acid transferase